MKKINLAITGCLGRMGQQLIKTSKKNTYFKLVTLTENILINKKEKTMLNLFLPSVLEQFARFHHYKNIQLQLRNLIYI